MQLLILDDDARILRGLARALRSAAPRDWETTTAGSGAEALELLRAGRFDVVVSDMRMPGMDGPSFLSEVRDRWPDTARLVLSGHADPPDSARAARVAHQFLDKPLRVGELVAIIARVAEARRRLPAGELRSALGTLGDLPCAPASHGELVQIAADASPDVLVAVVERDPALAAAVLKLASTSFFIRGEATSDVRQAVVRLGPNVARATLPAATVVLAPEVGGLIDRVRARGFEAGSLAALLVPPAASTDAFAAGLLAELGVIALAALFPAETLSIEARAAAGGRPRAEFERARWGASHAEIGGYLLALWGLPPALVDGVRFHQAPAHADATSRPIAIAAHVAHAALSGEPIDETTAGVAAARLDSLRGIEPARASRRAR